MAKCGKPEKDHRRRSSLLVALIFFGACVPSQPDKDQADEWSPAKGRPKTAASSADSACMERYDFSAAGYRYFVARAVMRQYPQAPYALVERMVAERSLKYEMLANDQGGCSADYLGYEKFKGKKYYLSGNCALDTVRSTGSLILRVETVRRCKSWVL